MNSEAKERPNLYIEQAFPSKLLNLQVQQETGTNPFKGVHRWFSRKPLCFSRASVLASLLPSDITPEGFERLLNMPVNPKSNFRLYQQTPSPSIIEEVVTLCRQTWGDDICILDAFGGGGSIPFEAVRYGLTTIASDLNPVAVAIMKASIEIPATLGIGFWGDLRYWVDWVGKQVEQRLQSYFPSLPGQRTRDYLWTHTVQCFECALSVPLSASWWLNSSPSAKKSGRTCAVHLIVPPVGEGNCCTFEIVQGISKGGKIDDYDPVASGTISRANARCPRCNTILPQSYLWSEGQAGRLGYQIYAVAYYDSKSKLLFRTPSQIDLDAVNATQKKLLESESQFLQADLIPNELVNEFASKSNNIALVGIYGWRDLYTPRQLMSLITLLDIVQSAVKVYAKSASVERVQALALWLAMILDRCADKNSRLTLWNPGRTTVDRATTTHSLNLMWNFPEVNGATRLWQLAGESVSGDYEELCHLVGTTLQDNPEQWLKKITIQPRDAANLFGIPSGSITAIVTDPPYYSSVSYGELADMFYVWEKRVLSTIFPDLYTEDLSNKEVEAIANPGRFKGMPNASELADRDYEMKLARAFAEYHRVLRDDGVLTVQFNHKDSGAWDILSQTLINAGFEITATWAVNTEDPNSIHQAEKNAVNSTVLLVCRKRVPSPSAWWEDIQPQVRQAVMQRVPVLQEAGMEGIDLYLAAFGPALQVLSKNWPVRDRTNSEVRPEAALKEARDAVVDQRMVQMTEGRYVQLDPVSRFYLIAWDCFLAREFSFDEARLLALSTGDISIAELRDRYHILTKKGNDVVFLTPRERVRLGEVKVQAPSYDRMVDALHAALSLYMDEGITAVQRFFDRTNLLTNPDFKQFVELVLKMLPDACEEHKALSVLLMSDIKLRSYVQMPLFADVEVETYEQPRLF